MVMEMGAYWGHGVSAVMAVVGVAWMRAARTGHPVLLDERHGEERRLAQVLEFPAPKMPSEFEVFAERARLLG
jgi:hypothetical protein